VPGGPSRRRDGAEPARVPAPLPRRLHRRVAADARHVPALQVRSLAASTGDDGRAGTGRIAG